MNSNSNWAVQEFQFQLKIMSQQLIIDFENSNSTRATNNYLFISRIPIPTSNPLKSYLFFGGLPNSNFQADFLELINFQGC